MWRRVVREREGGEPDQAATDREARAIVVIAHLLSLGPAEGAVGEGIRKRARFWHGTTRAVNGGRRPFRFPYS